MAPAFGKQLFGNQPAIGRHRDEIGESPTPIDRKPPALAFVSQSDPLERGAPWQPGVPKSAENLRKVERVAGIEPARSAWGS